MKIRLQVKTSSGGTFPWEHTGTRVLVGRDPDCDLSFPDDQTRQVISWRHAQIDLSPRGALLRDLGSTNGTFVDGARIEQPVRLTVGNEIRLGHEGPCLQVAAIDVAPSTSAAPASSSRSYTAGAGPAVPIHSPVSDQPAGGTRAMLVQLERQHRNSLRLFGGVAAVVLLAIVAGVLMLGRNSQPVVVVGSGPTGPAPSRDHNSSDESDSTAPASITAASPVQPSTATVEPDTEPTTTSPPDWKQVVAPFENSLVWLGFKTQSGFRLPLSAGFAVGADRIVTTGIAASYLKQHHQPENGSEAIAFCQDEPDRFVKVKEFRVHPRYNPMASDQQTVDINNDVIDYNVGVLVLEKPLSSKPCTVARGDDLIKRLKSGTPIVVAGFDITDELRQNDFDPLNPPVVVSHSGTMGGASVPGGASIQSRRVLKLEAPEGLSGSPIFDRDGKVVGVLWVNKGSFGVVASTFEELWK